MPGIAWCSTPMASTTDCERYREPRAKESCASWKRSDGGGMPFLHRLARLEELSGGEALSDDVTVLTVSVAPGPSALDNGAPVPMPSKLTVDEGVEILAGGDPHRTTLSIRGHGKWTQSAAFHEACVGALAMGRGDPGLDAL